MVFSSMVFLCVFLPAAFCLHLLLPGMRAKNFLLVVASLVFYAYGEPIYVILLVASSAGNYILARLTGECPKIRKLTMTLAVVINLGLLVIFKYSGFLVDTFNSVTGAGIPVPQVRMPIGISFFTFQALSYVIDVYRGDASVQKNFGKVLLYISFFPQLIAGPIVKYHDVEAEINNRKQTPEEIGKGIRRFIAGLSKRFLSPIQWDLWRIISLVRQQPESPVRVLGWAQFPICCRSILISAATVIGRWDSE